MPPRRKTLPRSLDKESRRALTLPAASLIGLGDFLGAAGLCEGVGARCGAAGKGLFAERGRCGTEGGGFLESRESGLGSRFGGKEGRFGMMGGSCFGSLVGRFGMMGVVESLGA